MNAPVPQGSLEKEKKIYTGTAARLLKLRGAGCTQEEAAKACGVDASYVSQLEAEDDFKIQLNELIRKTFEAQSKIDENYTQIEEKLSAKLLRSTEYMVAPDQILRALKFANEAKRKMPIPSGGHNGNHGPNGEATLQPVTLILPVVVARTFVMNPIGEVVSVDGQELTTLPSANIQRLVKEKAAKQLEDKKANGARSVDPYSDL